LQSPLSPYTTLFRSRTEVDGQPGVGDDASVPRDAPRRDIVDVGLPDTDETPAEQEKTDTAPAPAAPEAPADAAPEKQEPEKQEPDRKSTRLNSSHVK